MTGIEPGPFVFQPKVLVLNALGGLFVSHPVKPSRVASQPRAVKDLSVVTFPHRSTLK